MREKAVDKYPWSLEHVPDHLKTREMCNEAVEKYPWSLEYVPHDPKFGEMCEKAVEKDPWSLRYVTDHFKTWGDVRKSS